MAGGIGYSRLDEQAVDFAIISRSSPRSVSALT